MPASVKEETLASAMPMRETLEGWERLQPVEMSVRGFYAQLVPGSYPGEAGPLWDFAAGVVHGELWFDPQTEDARDGSLALRHVYSHLDGVTGEPLLLEVPLEPLPAWWHHHEPSFVEDAGPGVAAPRCPAGERRDDPTVIEAFSPGEALLVERLVGERCSGSMVKGPLLE